MVTIAPRQGKTLIEFPDKALLYNTLSMYEDIQDELGVGLGVLAGALRQGYVYDKEGSKVKVNIHNTVAGYAIGKKWINEYMAWRVYELKDYKKTWALTKEELENEKDANKQRIHDRTPS